jgi:AcrR family transcriptional regulator
VAAALQLVTDEGADALSMRTLAQRLDSGTATLYRHFANRAEVVARVVDHVFGTIEFDAEQLRALRWQTSCKTLAQAMFDALDRHRNVAPLLAQHVPVGPNAMAHRERLISILLDNGFSPRLAALSYATLARYVLGFAIQLAAQTTDGDLDDAKSSTTFHAVDPDLFPATMTVADHIPVPLEDEFAFGLELIVSGLTQQLRRERGRRH